MDAQEPYMNDEPRFPEMFWLFWLLILILIGLLTSCKTKYVTVPEIHQVVVEKHDTLTSWDSIYQKDSVYMWMQGDTIWKEKTIIKYRDRIVGKTVYRDSVKVDSVRVPYPVKESVSKFEKLRLRAGGFIVGIFISIILFLVRSFVNRAR
jgi:hypothetical protein